MDDAVQSYVDGIDPAFRPLFDQIHALVMVAHLEAAVARSGCGRETRPPSPTASSRA